MNTYAYQVMPEDTDTEKMMKVTSLCRTSINAIGRYIKEEGFGVDVMQSDGKAWALSRYALEFDTRPSLYSRYTVSVWDGEPGNITVTRCLRLSDEAGREIGRGITDWCVIDCATRGLVRPPAQLFSSGAGSAIPCERPSRISAINFDRGESRTVHRSDCDFNGHMNNLRYVEMMFDIMPEDYVRPDSHLRLCAFFHRESLPGDTLTLGLGRIAHGYGCIIAKSSSAVCTLALREI